MRRYVVLAAISVAALLALGTLLYFWTGGSKKVTSHAMRAIPADVGILIKSDNIDALSQKLRNESQFWATIAGFKLVADADRILNYADSLRRNSTTFNQLIFANPVFLSVHPVGKGEPSILLTANMPVGIKSSDILGLMQQQVFGTHKIVEKEYNGVTIFSAESKAGENSSNFSVAFHQNVVMASTSLLLVESAIGQLGSNSSLMEDKSFQTMLKTAGTRVDGNVFINHANIPALFNQQVKAAYRKGFSSLASLSQWSELDLIVKNDAIFLNGFSQASDSLNVYYKIFAKQKPVALKVTDVLPAQTSALVFLGISDMDQYLNDYRKYLDVNSTLRPYLIEIERTNKAMGSDIGKLYGSFFGKELALAFIPFDGEEYRNCWYVVASTKGQSLAREQLLNLIESYAAKAGKSVREFERTFNIDREKSAKIYQMPAAGIHNALFGSLFSEVDDKFFTFIDSYVIFGSSVESLSRLILANVHNKQLSADFSFKQFSESLSPESNFTAYINPGKAEMLYGRMLEPSAAARLLSRMDILRKLQGAAIQLSGGRSMVFNNICARYSPFSSDDPQTVWETRLDTTFSMKPQLVINHNTQHREIFVQDRMNNIYLINDIGRVMWRKPLGEPIIGEVTQVDLYRNGKLQLVFNTKTYIYIIDRNGNNIDGFPAKFRSPATNPVAVFDYEGNRDYRFFVAGEDRRIYVYDRNGNVVTGWDFERSEKIVEKPLQHFRVSNRDYIVFADENRPYILDRRGNERVKPARFFSQAPNSTFVLEASSSKTPPRLVTTDTLGFVRFIYFDGRVDDKAIRTLSPSHGFDYQDMDADGLKDFIFVDGKNLYVYKNNGKELFSKKFQNDLIPTTIYFHFGARDRKLGLVCSERSEIFLVNGDGNFYKGFPLKGITPFSIGQFANTKSKFNLVVGSSTGFVLNYAVQ